MVPKLNSAEIRILGCLIEKQLSTPDYYPLTVNALQAACNQKSNREPVMNLSENEVKQSLQGLIDKYLVREKNLPGSRTPKFEHKLSGTLTREFDFSIQQLAILAVLFLRGAQTVGEIKGRTQRMAEFYDLDQVENCLRELAEHERGPFVKALPRQPGRREIRYCHLFGGEPEPQGEIHSDNATTSYGEADLNEIQILRSELQELRQEVEDLKLQVEKILHSGN